MPAYGTKPRCAAVQQVVGYWKCCGPSAPLGWTAALDPKPGIMVLSPACEFRIWPGPPSLRVATDHAMEAWYVLSLHGHAPRGRVTWQSYRHCVASRSRGRSRRARSSFARGILALGCVPDLSVSSMRGIPATRPNNSGVPRERGMRGVEV
jgi:hypothetical protein